MTSAFERKIIKSGWSISGANAQLNPNTHEIEPVKYGVKPKIPRKDFPTRKEIQEQNEKIKKLQEKYLISQGDVLFMTSCPLYCDDFGSTHLTYNSAMLELEKHIYEDHDYQDSETVDALLQNAKVFSWVCENAKEVAENKT